MPCPRDECVPMCIASFSCILLARIFGVKLFERTLEILNSITNTKKPTETINWASLLLIQIIN